MSDRRVFWRMVVVLLAVIGVWSALGVRLSMLHLGTNEWCWERMEKIRSSESSLLALRGRIIDRQAVTLALSLKMSTVAVDPKFIKEMLESDRPSRVEMAKRIAPTLADILGMSEHEVRALTTRPNKQYVVVKRHVEPEIVDKIREAELKGVIVEPDARRFYPHGSLLCHVLGFVTMYDHTWGGIEARLDEQLRGKHGIRTGLRDGRRQMIHDTRVEIPPEEGNTVQLTIDVQVQHMVEEALADAVREKEAKGAWGVVQECKTGRILAMASVPNFNLNDFSPEKGSETNQVLNYTYEPGSTMKALTFAAVFEEKLATEKETIHCEGGNWTYRGRPLRDHHGYGLLTVEDVLKKSSNIGTAKLALRLGPERLERYFREFGVGNRTGIELPGEGRGLFTPHTQWDKLMVTRIPMGHAVAVTALQMVSAYSAIANGGYRMKPYIVERILAADGTVLEVNEPQVVARPISEETAARVRRMMLRVTEDRGTATRARIEGYEVAGKTGTAEKVVDGRYDKRRNIASFAGFLPAQNPELCILVVVDEPGVWPRTGGYVAAPAFRVIAEQSLRYLHIPPEGTDSSGAALQTQIARADP